jgi:hypothetical protein
MARIWVTDDTDTIRVEVHEDDDGSATAECLTCPWTTEPGRVDSTPDVIAEAGIHADRPHP